MVYSAVFSILMGTYFHGVVCFMMDVDLDLMNFGPISHHLTQTLQCWDQDLTFAERLLSLALCSTHYFTYSSQQGLKGQIFLSIL